MKIRDMNNTPKLVILVGNIACGKSMIADLLYREYDFFCISLDGMRRMLGAGNYIFDTRLEPIIQSTEKFMINHAFKKGLDIVIDDACNVDSFFRNKTITLAKEHGYITAIIEMPKWDLDTCVNRRLKANFNVEFDRSLWVGVYKKFKAMYNEIHNTEADFVLRLNKTDKIKERLAYLYKHLELKCN